MFGPWTVPADLKERLSWRLDAAGISYTLNDITGEIEKQQDIDTESKQFNFELNYSHLVEVETAGGVFYYPSIPKKERLTYYATQFRMLSDGSTELPFTVRIIRLLVFGVPIYKYIQDNI